MGLDFYDGPFIDMPGWDLLLFDEFTQPCCRLGVMFIVKVHFSTG